MFDEIGLDFRKYLKLIAGNISNKVLILLSID